MSELQGAVGLAQLSKLSKIIESQQENASRILEVFQKVESSLGITPRKSPIGSEETFDAVVLQTPDNFIPKQIRSSLIEVGVSTKILPEATTWHFAGDWTHLDGIREQIQNNENYLVESRKILSRHFAVPNFCIMPNRFLSKIETAIKGMKL
jgi:8-amino-3,8-dideoxy-alpha-D-manno-octulosonate transaminase